MAFVLRSDGETSSGVAKLLKLVIDWRMDQLTGEIEKFVVLKLVSSCVSFTKLQYLFSARDKKIYYSK